MSSDEEESGELDGNPSCSTTEWEALIAQTRRELLLRLDEWKEQEANWCQLKESIAERHRRQAGRITRSLSH